MITIFRPLNIWQDHILKINKFIANIFAHPMPIFISNKNIFLKSDKNIDRYMYAILYRKFQRPPSHRIASIHGIYVVINLCSFETGRNSQSGFHHIVTSNTNILVFMASLYIRRKESDDQIIRQQAERVVIREMSVRSQE